MVGPPSGELVDPRSLSGRQGGLNLRLDTARVGIIGGLRLRRLPLNELRRFHDERWYDTRNTHGNILYQVDPRASFHPTVTGWRRRLYESNPPIACDQGYSRHTVNRKLTETINSPGIAAHSVNR